MMHGQENIKLHMRDRMSSVAGIFKGRFFFSWKNEGSSGNRGKIQLIFLTVGQILRHLTSNLLIRFRTNINV